VGKQHATLACSVEKRSQGVSAAAVKPGLLPQRRGGKATLSGEGRKRLTPAFPHAMPSPPEGGRCFGPRPFLNRRIATDRGSRRWRWSILLPCSRHTAAAGAPRGANAGGHARGGAKPPADRRLSPSAVTAPRRAKSTPNAVVFNPPSQQGRLLVAFLPLPCAQTRSFAPLSARLARLVTNARYRQDPCTLSTYPQASH
jgi:hypothetical protein